MSNEFKEVTSMEEVEKALKEMRRAWEDICEAFHVDAQIKLQPEVIRNNIRATMMDLNELENMEYVRKSGKPLEKLHVTYLKCLIKSAYLNLESEDAKVWTGEVERYLGEVITEDVLADTGLKVEDDTDVTLDSQTGIKSLFRDLFTFWNRNRYFQATLIVVSICCILHCFQDHGLWHRIDCCFSHFL